VCKLTLKKSVKFTQLCCVTRGTRKVSLRYFEPFDQRRPKLYFVRKLRKRKYYGLGMRYQNALICRNEYTLICRYDYALICHYEYASYLHISYACKK
jgi:hypothetical protein